MSRKIIRDIALYASAVLGILLTPGAGSAQNLNPDRSAIDSNGVNLLNGWLNLPVSPVSIGPSDNALTYTYYVKNSTIALDNFTLVMQGDPETGGSHPVYIVTADRTVSFTCNSGVCTNPVADGGQLVQTSLDGDGYWTFDYIQNDGTRINFNNFIRDFPHANYLQATAFGDTITYPSGYAVNIGWGRTLAYTLRGGRNFYAFRINTVNDTRGYTLSLAYLRDDGLTSANYSEYSKIKSVTASNRAGDPPAGAGSPWPSAQFTYSGTTTTITDPAGQSTQYLSPTFNQFQIVRPGHTAPDMTVNYTANNSGLPFTFATRVASISRGSDTWQYAYTVGSSNVTSTVTDPAGQVSGITTTSLTPTRVATSTDGLGRVTTYTYDSYNRPQRITRPEGDYTEVTYDGRGNVTSTTLVSKTPGTPADIVTSATYPADCGNAVTCNEPTATTDARGAQTDYSYDPTTGLVTSVTRPAPSAGAVRPQTRYSYTPLYAYFRNNAGTIVPAPTPIYVLTGTSTCLTNATCAGTSDEAKGTISYGPQTAGTGNNLIPVSVTKAAGDGSLATTATSSFDTIGNLRSLDGPLPGSSDVTVYRYDADRRVVGIVSADPDGAGPTKNRAQRTTYNGDGLVTLMEQGTTAGQQDADWAGFTSTQQLATMYDNAARKVQETLSASGTAYAVKQYSYDAVGHVDCIAVRMNPAAFGSLPAACAQGTAGAFGPDRITRFSYDAASQLLSVTDGYGTSLQRTVVAKSYTANGRVASVTDANGNMTSYAYDGFGRLAKTNYPSPSATGASSPSDYEQLAYDAAGNIVSRRLRDGTSIGYAYDALNRLTTKTLPSGEAAVTYAYNAISRPITITQGGSTLSYGFDALGRMTSEGQPFGTLVSAYDAAGRRTRLTWQDGFYVTYDYDALGEMTAIHENGGTALASYSYDDLGRRTARSFANGTTTTYGFDAISRLSALNLNGATPNAMTFDSYSPAGELTSRTSSNDAFAWTGGVNVDRSYTPNGLNQYVSVAGAALGYDARGNLTSSAGTTYGYSAENRLKSVSNGATLYYDPIGRLSEFDTTSSTRFAYDGAHIATEVANPGGAILRRYVFGPGADEPVVWYEGASTGDRRYLDQDERGSVVRVTSQSGATLAINSYDEYGIPGANNAGRFQYTGQAWLPEIGLYYYKARIYSATLGRFMQTDPAGYGDGLNWYDYVHGNPISGTDPNGLADTLGIGQESSSNAPPDSNNDIVVNGVRGKPVSIGAKLFTVPPGRTCGICLASITNGADKGRIILTSEGSVPSLAKNSKGVPGWYSRNRDGTITFHPLTAMDYVIGGMVLVAPPIALDLGVGAAFAEGAESLVPSTLARVIPNGIPASTLGAPGAVDVFVTTPEAIEGLDAAGIAQRLTIPESPTGYQVFKFSTPESGLASPVFRTNPGFVGGGYTAGGAPEFVIPNGPIPPGATVTRIP